MICVPDWQALMVPKVDGQRALENTAELTGGKVGLIALIETPVALAGLPGNAAFPQVVALMLGSEDQAASLGVKPDGGADASGSPVWGGRCPAWGASHRLSRLAGEFSGVGPAWRSDRRPVNRANNILGVLQHQSPCVTSDSKRTLAPPCLWL